MSLSLCYIITGSSVQLRTKYRISFGCYAYMPNNLPLSQRKYLLIFREDNAVTGFLLWNNEMNKRIRFRFGHSVAQRETDERTPRQGKKKGEGEREWWSSAKATKTQKMSHRRRKRCYACKKKVTHAFTCRHILRTFNDVTFTMNATSKGNIPEYVIVSWKKRYKRRPR